jgi:prepilin-type processing-associated H-X9-DG protein
VELLVALGIVGILIGLLLPAVLSSRARARRLQCVSNLRQIGVAIHGYYDAWSCLPFGEIMSYDRRYAGNHPPCTSGFFDKSFLVAILPYLEQRSLFDSVNMSLSILARENSTVLSASVPAYACPDDEAAGVVRPFDETVLLPLGLVSPGERVVATFTSYVGNHGTLPVSSLPNLYNGCRRDPRVVAQEDGCLNGICPITLGSISDGASATILASERATSLLAKGSDRIFRTQGLFVFGLLGDTLFATDLPPNANGLPCVSESPFVTSSLHGGGVNVLMVDGSAHFVTSSVNSWPIDSLGCRPKGSSQILPTGYWRDVPAPGVWQKLSTRAGHDVVSASDY